MPSRAGELLSAQIARAPLATRDALILAIAIADLLDGLHRRNLVHGDIGPHSLMWDGLEMHSRSLTHALDLTDGAPPIASQPDRHALQPEALACLAPELSGRLDRPIDARADLYALGVLLYWLLAGQPPLVAHDPGGWVHAHLARTPRPLGEIVPELPAPLPQLVARLLEKLPEKRYHSAWGVRVDLLRCLDALGTGNATTGFELGSEDFPAHIETGGCLHGRQDALARLVQICSAAQAGGCHAQLILGPSGIGKSALLRELEHTRSASPGVFVHIRCATGDASQHTLPCATLSRLIDALIRQASARCAETPDVLEGGALSLPAAVRVALDAIAPGLHPPTYDTIAVRSDTDALQADVSALLRAMATRTSPLTLLIDDLHLADAVSRAVIAKWMVRCDIDHLVCITTCLDDAREAAPALRALVSDMRAAHGDDGLMALGPLTEDAVAAWLVRALHGEPRRIRPLATIVVAKTDGNPHHVQRFLRMAQRRGMLQFDRSQRTWCWDESQLRASPLSDNVVDLLLHELHELDDASRSLLSAGALLGERFGEAEAGRLVELAPGPLGDASEQLLAHGFVRRDGRATLAFQHHRLRDAATRLLDPVTTRRLHARRGASLLSSLRDDSRERIVPEILSHLAQGLEADSDPALLGQFAALTHEAASRARAAGDPAQGLTLIHTTLKTLGPTAWETQPGTLRKLHEEAQWCALLSCDFSAAETHFTELANRAATPQAMLEPRLRMISQLTLRAHHADALAMGLSALAELGQPIDPNPDMARLARELADFRLAAARQAPKHTAGDENRRAVLRLLRALTNPALFDRPLLAPFLGLRALSLAGGPARAGLATLSAHAGTAFILLDDDYRSGDVLAASALRAAEHHDDEQDRAEAMHATALLRTHWQHPLSESIELAHAAFERLERSGDRHLASQTFIESVRLKLETGEPLNEVLHEIERGLAHAASTGSLAVADVLALHRQSVHALTGRTQAPTDLDDGLFRESTWRDSGSASGFALAHLHACKLMLANHADDAAAALAQAAEGAGWLTNMTGLLLEANFRWHAGLALCRGLADGLLVTPGPAYAEVTSTLARLARWRDAAPASFSHKHALLAAEFAALLGNPWEALTLFSTAMEAARAGRFLQDEALTARRAALFCRRQALTTLAQDFDRHAHDAYARWGANALARDGATEESRQDDSLDLASILKGVETIAGERNHDTLLGKLMTVVLEHACAERGMLLLADTAGEQRPEAWIEQTPGGVEHALQSTRPARFTMPGWVLRTATRAHKPLVIDDASRDSRLARDPEVLRRTIRSILCVPLLRRGEPIGVLYLENNLADRLFTANQARVLGVIAGQAAVALESARLYADMDAQIRLRTAQLEEALALAEEATRAKSDFLANMSHEIRTPMNAIIGMSELAMQVDLGEKARGYVGKVHRAAENLLGIINEILDFSKIEAGMLTLEHAEFSLDEVLEHLSGLFAYKATDRGLEFAFDLAPDLPTLLIGDSLRLGQIFTNLANNAIKFTEAGSIVIGLEPVSRDAQRIELHCWVRDTGIGMTAEQCSRLFQSFTQAEVSTSRKFGGTGLGLAISKKMVEAMNGRIWVESGLGMGSTFHFQVRLSVADGTATLSELPLALRLKGRRVLIADDQPAARDTLARLSRGLGLECADAASGEAALRLIDQHLAEGRPFDAVLLDWKMPALDGLSCARRIAAEYGARAPATVLLAAHGQDEIQGLLGNDAPRGFMHKPTTAGMLLHALDNALHGTTARAESPPQTRSAPRSLLHLRGLRVLLVEDNDMNQELAMELLLSAGIHVDLAENGLAALERLGSGNRFDGVLMDCQMPLMDGYTATRQIRANPALRDLPVVAMTANATYDERDKVLAAGMNDLLFKPLNVDTMFECITRWFAPQRRAVLDSPVASPDPAQAQDAAAGSALQRFSGIDTARGLATCMNLTDLYQRQLQRFAKGSRRFEAQFDDALSANDQAAMSLLAHTLKSTAGSIGASELANAAAALEAACLGASHGEQIEHLRSSTLGALARVQKALASLSAPNASGSDDTSVPSVTERIARLRGLVTDSDADATTAARDLAASLSEDDPLYEKLNAIREALERFDYDTADILLRALPGN